ncbi:unnamed protein product [Dicrocoelium dendriticum]|nr:unnamed protein product [Dicrocoelium dendriticum]
MLVVNARSPVLVLCDFGSNRSLFPAPYGSYAGVQRDLVISLSGIGVCLALVLLLLLVAWWLKSRRRRAQRLLGWQEKQRWLIRHAQKANDPATPYTPSRCSSLVDFYGPAGPVVGQLTPHQLHLSKETLEFEPSKENCQRIQRPSEPSINRSRTSLFNLPMGRSSSRLEMEYFDPIPIYPGRSDIRGSPSLGVELNLNQSNGRVCKRLQPIAVRYIRPVADTEPVNSQRNEPRRLPKGRLTSPDMVPSPLNNSSQSHTYQDQPSIMEGLMRYNSYADELDQSKRSTSSETVHNVAHLGAQRRRRVESVEMDTFSADANRSHPVGKPRSHDHRERRNYTHRHSRRRRSSHRCGTEQWDEV